MASSNHKVLAIDADPDSNFARSLGLSEEVYQKIVPISKQRKLIEERTGAKIREYGQMFALNPKVDDIADSYGQRIEQNITLLVMGGADKGAAGCACPENVLLRTLLQNLILFRDEVVIMDMEAGIEHLGRGTTKAIDAFIIVVEPGKNSFQTADKIIKLASEIGLYRFFIVGNKVQNELEESHIRECFSSHNVIGILPLCQSVKKADFNNKTLFKYGSLELIQKFQDSFLNLQSIIKNSKGS